MKRFTRSALSLLIFLGIGLALWPLGQIAYARWNQRALRTAWNEEAQNAAKMPSTKKSGATARTRVTPARANPVRARSSHPKLPPTRIIIPDIGLDAVVVQGMDAASLQRGPGHAPYSALPGQLGNCAIAAHRNVFGSWFLRVDELLPGARINLQTPRETFRYEVAEIFSVPDNVARILRPMPGGENIARLTLITCTLPRTTSRVAVIAQLVPPDAPSGF